MPQRSKNRCSGLFGFITRYPRLILSLSMLLAVLSAIFTYRKMEFLTGRDDLMPKHTSFKSDYRAYKAEFGDQEEIVVVIESDDAERAGRFGERLAHLLSRDTNQIRDIFFPFGLPFFQKNGLLFMPLDDIKSLRRNLTKVKPVLKELAAAPSVQTLFTYLTTEIDAYIGTGGNGPAAASRLSRILYMLDKLGMGFTKFGADGSGGVSLEEFFFQNEEGKESSFSKAGKTQILTLLPARNASSFVPAEGAIKIARMRIDELLKLPEFRGVKVGMTGTPVLEHEEMTTSQRDISLATAISIILTVILLLLAFRGILNVIAAMTTLIIAVSLSFGFATLAVGHLNILSMVFAIMLIGIGIEYGIQVVLRYQEELGAGEERLHAISKALNRNVWAVIMAAATVAAAFLTFVFTDFRGIAELGIIAAGGIVICVITTFTVLPAMLVILGRYRDKPSGQKATPATADKHTRDHTLGPFKQLLFGYPRAVVAITMLLCALCIYPLSKVKFDYNLMNLQAKGLESVEYAHKLMRSAENAGYFAVVTAGSADEALQKTKELEKLPAVDHVVSFNSFIPEDQRQKLAELSALRKELEDIRPQPYEEDLRLMELPAVFESFRNSVERMKKMLAAKEIPEEKQVGDFLTILDAFFAKLEKEKDRNAVGMLKDFQGGMLAELPQKIAVLKKSLSPSPVTAADVPEELRSRFIGKTGHYLLQVAPRGEIFDREPLVRFINEVQTVDRRATGEPVLVYESMTIMRNAYVKAFIYALVAIVGILLVTFRSVKFAFIGLMPLVVGVLFMVGGMWACGIDFNSANIIVMPLVLGIAVDSGIYIINRFRNEDETSVEVVTRSTGVGVILNTLTIMASFGALMVARHQGVFSIGVVMSLGMLACQLAFVIMLPAVLTLVGKR